MPKLQLPDDDPAKGNAAVPELDDEALTASDDDDAEQVSATAVGKERTTILDGEDTQPLQVHDDDGRPVRTSQGEEAGARGTGDLMQDEEDTDGNV
jgi:hypothetical protein